MENFKKNLENISRRRFLKNLSSGLAVTLSPGPLNILIQSIMNGAISSALAETSQISPRKYVHMLSQFAPARWTFDLFLTPFNNDHFIANKGLGNYFESTNIQDFTYKTYKYSISNQELYLPILWSSNVPHSNGSTRPMTDLLNNMLNIRGIKVGNPDHTASQAMQFLPLGSSYSLPAIASDYAKNPISAVSVNVGQFKMKSQFGNTAVILNPANTKADNLIKSILKPFTRSTGNLQFNDTDLLKNLNLNLNQVNINGRSFNPAIDVITKASQQAKDLLSTGFGNIDLIWETLYVKYYNLCNRAIQNFPVINGFNDKTILTDGSDQFRFNKNILSKDKNIFSIIDSQTNYNYLAGQFAITEFILTSNLSNSIAISTENINGLLINIDRMSNVNDEHETSGIISSVINSYSYSAFAACLLELIDILKNKNIFDETVIITGNEFGRNPRADGTGSDHAFNGSSSVIYSGCINGPIVVGNVKNSSDSKYLGSWGDSALVNELGTPIDMGHWASTIATLIRVPSPVTASQSLITIKDNIVNTMIEKARQVNS